MKKLVGGMNVWERGFSNGDWAFVPDHSQAILESFLKGEEAKHIPSPEAVADLIKEVGISCKILKHLRDTTQDPHLKAVLNQIISGGFVTDSRK